MQILTGTALEVHVYADCADNYILDVTNFVAFCYKVAAIHGQSNSLD